MINEALRISKVDVGEDGKDEKHEGDVAQTSQGVDKASSARVVVARITSHFASVSWPGITGVLLANVGDRRNGKKVEMASESLRGTCSGE